MRAGSIRCNRTVPARSGPVGATRLVTGPAGAVAASAGPAVAPTASNAAMPTGIPLRSHRRSCDPDVESVIALPPRRLVTDKDQSLDPRSPPGIGVSPDLSQS